MLSRTDQLRLLFPSPGKQTLSLSPWGGVGKFALEEQWFVQPFLQSSHSRGRGLRRLGCQDALLPHATVSALCSRWGDSGQPFPGVPSPAVRPGASGSRRCPPAACSQPSPNTAQLSSSSNPRVYASLTDSAAPDISLSGIYIPAGTAKSPSAKSRAFLWHQRERK